MQRIEELKKLNSEIIKKLEAFERTDPKKVQNIIKERDKAKAAANRWTDNLFTLKDWMKDQNSNYSNTDLESRFPVLKNLDNIE